MNDTEKSNDIAKDSIIDDIATHLLAIAEICEKQDISNLSLSFDNGIYKFASIESDIFFSEETEKHKEQVLELAERIEQKILLAKDGIYV